MVVGKVVAPSDWNWEDNEVILGLLDWGLLDSQQGNFKIAMKSNTPTVMEPRFDINFVA